MRYRVRHTTTYLSDKPVSVCHNEACLRPRELAYQHVESYRLIISPAPSVKTTREDYYGNSLVSFSFNEGYDTLTVTATSTVRLSRRPLDHDDQLPWSQIAASLRTPASALDSAASEFCWPSPRVSLHDELRDYAQESFSEDRRILDGLQELTTRIWKDFEFDPKSTTVATPVRQVFDQRRGVCQDFAHLQIAMLRSLGLAARYVSGYLRTYPPEGQPRLVGADASHAWLSVYCGPQGWIDVDPTNNKIPDNEHVTVGWGRDYGDVCPLKGVYTGGEHHRLDVSVDVEPLEPVSAS